jgi:hypothetical protein
MLFDKHRWRNARCCSSVTTRNARCCSSVTARNGALPTVKRYGGKKQYVMTNTRAVASIFGIKQPKMKSRKGITYVFKLER